MYTLLVIIALIAIVISYKIMNKELSKIEKKYKGEYKGYDYEKERDEKRTHLMKYIIMLVIVTAFSIIMIFFNISKIGDYKMIPNKINITEESNKEIEKQLDQVVKEYLTYEKNTIENVKPENAIAIAQAYPDLRSQTLVSELMKNYNDNNKELKKLKLKQVEFKKIKWNLYFGG